MQNKFCSQCHITILKPHPELYFWKKCSVCGFCCIDEEMIAKEPHIDKMSKHPHFARLDKNNKLK